MRPLVEDAGKPWYAGWLSRVCGLSGADRGTRWVGGRRVRWFIGRAGVTVLHPDAAGRRIYYHVRLSETPLPSGSLRWWFHCPACARRVDVLYLPPGRDRLGCRTCLGLAYRSQNTRRKTRCRACRPQVEWDDDFHWWIRR
jgi:hypothetical protein